MTRCKKINNAWKDCEGIEDFEKSAYKDQKNNNNVEKLKPDN